MLCPPGVGGSAGSKPARRSDVHQAGPRRAVGGKSRRRDAFGAKLGMDNGAHADAGLGRALRQGIGTQLRCARSIVEPLRRLVERTGLVIDDRKSPVLERVDPVDAYAQSDAAERQRTPRPPRARTTPVTTGSGRAARPPRTAPGTLRHRTAGRHATPLSTAAAISLSRR